MNKTRVLDYLYRICATPSITETAGEVEMAVRLHEMLMEMDYFKKNPQNTAVYDIPNDPRGRKCTWALLEGGVKSAKTVVVSGHFDVVGVDEFGVNAPLAFDPIKYTQLLKTGAVTLEPSAKADLDSGDWLFGRGVMDMKFGIATCFEALSTAYEQLDTFEGNLLFVGVCDEEGNSAGMIGILPFLQALRQDRGLEYSGFIETEAYIPMRNDPLIRPVHVGSAGKVLPVIYCVGQAGHVDDPYGCLNPSQVTAKIIEKIEQNSKYCDKAGDAYGPAPMCLKHADTKTAYTVQTPISAYCYLSFLTYQSDPDYILSELTSVAKESFSEILQLVEHKRQQFVKMSGQNVPPTGHQPIVLSYGELYAMCKAARGESFVRHMEDFVKNCPEKDMRDLTVKILEQCHKFCPNRSPMVIICFAPPYYPNSKPVTPDSKTYKIVQRMKEYAANHLGERFEIDYTYDGISDMSYLNVSDNVNPDTLRDNFPLWNRGYTVPIELIRSLGFTFMNIGCWGKDAHKYTERLNLPYALEKTLPATWQCILEMLKF